MTTSPKKTTKKAAKKKANTAKRYSDAEKQDIVSFVQEINEEKGRGGVTAAAKKYGASPLSISKWLAESEGGVSVSRSSKSGPSNGRDKVLNELSSLNKTIAKKRKELDGLEARFEKLKSSL